MIHFEVDWPAFWLRFACGAAIGLLPGTCLHLSADLAWVWTPVSAAAIGTIVGIFCSEFWQDLYQRWTNW